MMKYYDILKKIRTEKNYTQKFVADFLKIKQQSYLNYELGITEPSIDKLIKLSELYQVTVGALVGTEDIE